MEHDVAENSIGLHREKHFIVRFIFFLRCVVNEYFNGIVLILDHVQKRKRESFIDYFVPYCSGLTIIVPSCILTTTNYRDYCNIP